MTANRVYAMSAITALTAQNTTGVTDIMEAGNIVVDPVMVATSGARLISEDAISILKSRLLPLATVITRTFHDRM